MKLLLLMYCGLVGLAGCGQKAADPAPSTDSFLGHWQTDSFRAVGYDAKGNLTSDTTYPQGRTFDITATTVTSAAGTSTETFTYTRQGEMLRATSNAHFTDDVLYVHGLTATGFTYEQDHTIVDGRRSVVTMTFHR